MCFGERYTIGEYKAERPVSVSICRCLLGGVRCPEEALEVRNSTFGLFFKSSHHELMSGTPLWFPVGLAAF